MTPRPHERIYASPAEATGGAPMTGLPRFAEAHAPDAELLALCDFRHPLGDGAVREATALINARIEERALASGGALVEGADTPAGVALAAAAAAAGVRLHLVVPDSVPDSARAMIGHLGAELSTSPAVEGVAGAVSRAAAMAEALEGAAGPAFYAHPACVRAQAETTALEIWHETGGELDAVVIGFGTGAELDGVASFLRARRSSARVVAVEPEDCPVLSGGQPAPHRITGLGPGFVPNRLKRYQIDEVIRVADRTAFEAARRVARLEGLAVGAASGAVLAAAVDLARRPDWQGKQIVAVLPTAAALELETPLRDGPRTTDLS